MKYNLAVCGGTFDHFHRGHREFLRYALSLSSRLLIGLTSNNYVREKNKGKWIDSYQIRKRSLEEFLRKEKAKDRVLIESIDDIFIPKVWQSLPIEAIVVSKNTLSSAREINLKRKEQGKYPLKIKAYQLIKSQNNEHISSSRIRNGEINREGRPYISPLWLKHKLSITQELRREFKKPFGKLIKDKILRLLPIKSGFAQDDKKPYLITVGDITTKTFNKLHLSQNISVIDFKVSRKKMYSNIKELGFSGKEKIRKIVNPPGSLRPTLFKVASQIFKLKVGYKYRLHPLILQIDGEEDLSVLPLTLASPLGSLIFYGQPGEGIVKVEVSEANKESAYKFVSRFI